MKYMAVKCYAKWEIRRENYIEKMKYIEKVTVAD